MKDAGDQIGRRDVMNATGRKQEGQVLVQVAMLMVVFLAFMALAIDIGNILTERRRMQNAADAGALAGAWEICFGNPGLAESTAQRYAIDENHAQVADVSIDGGRVTVYAREAADLYLARVFGINTAQINAVAVAACGGATSLCNLWPISFHLERWEDITECGYPGDDGDEGTFHVFNDGRFEEDDECFGKVDGKCYPACDGVYNEVELEGMCNCEPLIPPDGRMFRVGEGHRGWLLFPRPRAPYDYFDLGCADNCGDQVRCWIDSGSYTGEIPLPAASAGVTQTHDLCLPGQPGVDESVRIEIERDHIGDTPNVLIWDRPCETGDPSKVGQCPGDLYHIYTTGCIEILRVLEVDLMVKDEFLKDKNKPEKCLPNVKVIEAQRLCECNSECGRTDGHLPGTGEVRAVSLIK
jgi:hypothetical protein